VLQLPGSRFRIARALARRRRQFAFLLD